MFVAWCSYRSVDGEEPQHLTGVHRRQEVESKLNEVASDAVKSSLLSGATSPVQVYDFTTQQAFVSANKVLQVDSVAEEVRCDCTAVGTQLLFWATVVNSLFSMPLFHPCACCDQCHHSPHRLSGSARNDSAA